jgi:hypothetical protein
MPKMNYVLLVSLLLLKWKGGTYLEDPKADSYASEHLFDGLSPFRFGVVEECRCLRRSGEGMAAF